MRRIVLTGVSLFMSFSFLLSPLGKIPVRAFSPTPTEYILPYAGILPDHSLYIFKSFRDQILLLLTKDTLKKSRLYLIFADKHLSMGQSLLAKKKYTLAGDTFITGEKYLLTAVISFATLKTNHKLPPGVAEKVGMSVKKHEEILKELQKVGDDEMSKKKVQDALGITNQAIQQVALLK